MDPCLCVCAGCDVYNPDIRVPLMCVNCVVDSCGKLTTVMAVTSQACVVWRVVAAEPSGFMPALEFLYTLTFCCCYCCQSRGRLSVVACHCGLTKGFGMALSRAVGTFVPAQGLWRRCRCRL
jgi:hypothetical protein